MFAPVDGPAEILVELTRRFALGYTRTFVVERLAAHVAPASLAALVDVGATLGLAIAPRRVDTDAIDAIADGDAPLVVHCGAAGGGFALVTGVDGDRLRVWDARGGERAVARDEVAAVWTGVLATIERADEPGVRERGRAWRRLRELVFADWQPRVELAGARRSVWLGLVLVVALAVLGGASGGAAFVLAASGAIGTIASAAMMSGGATSRLCGGAGRRVSCASVLASQYARIAGVPVSAVALAFFASSSLVLAAASLASPDGAAACVSIAGWADLAALPAVAFFAFAQVRLGRVCTLCVAAHAALIGGAVTTFRAPLVGPPLVDALRALALLAIGFAVVLGAVAPFLHRAADADLDKARLAALLASPEVTLAELLATPPIAAPLPPGLGLAVGEVVAPIDVVAFVHPLCPACAETLVALEQLVLARPDRVRATVAIAAGHGGGDAAADRALCAALIALGDHAPAPATFGLLREVKRRDGHSAKTALATLGALLELDDAALAELCARGAERADRIAAIARRWGGVPTVLVAGRRTTAPLAHALAWCDDPRLAPIVRARRGTGTSSRSAARTSP